MSSPSRIVRALYALCGYSSVHWAAGRRRRALVWDALFVAWILLVFQLPTWVMFALLLAQAIDAAIIEPAVERSHGAYAIAGMLSMAVLAVLAVGVRATWAEAFRIPSGSEIPTLLVGDHIWVAKRAKHPARGDNAVFIYPIERDKDFIKRVVAVGGDTIEIRDDQLVVNGRPVPRVHVDEPCEYDDYVEDEGRWDRRPCDAWDETLDGHTYRVIFDRGGVPHSMQAVTVPADSYFFVGDNRDNSHDSRYFGAVPQPLIKGVARKIWWSEGPNGVRWGRIDQPVR